jgi:uncharacterized protein (TIGR02646 family)
MVHTSRRGSAPAELVRFRDRWTQRFLNIQPGGDWATRKAKRILRSALTPLAHGKCIYCESTLQVTSELAIEHYAAKTVATDLVFEWTNLLPACRKCNGAKAECDHGGALLKPDVEDPEPFFWVHPDTGKLEPHPSLDAAATERARRSIEICDLQRPALCTKRVLMIERVGRWLRRPPDELEEEWRELSHPGTEYKLVLRHVLRLRGLPTLVQADRDRFTSGK